MDQDAAGKAAHKQINPKGSIPTFVVDGLVKQGFSPDSLWRVILRAAHQHLPR